MHSYQDQLQRQVLLPERPRRIISLVPSQTELLYDLGLDKEVIAITKFCVHPAEWFRNKTRIGGTKNVNTALVGSLQPDLIIANKEENTKEQIALLETIAPVWISDITCFADALKMIESIGTITGKNEVAVLLINRIKKELATLAVAVKQRASKNYRTAYLIWKNPYMTAGGDTFIHAVLQAGGFRNIFADRTRYPIITINDLRNEQAELVFLSTEPYPFKQKHIDELAVALPGTRILSADGEMFSWYGSRLQHLSAYLQQLWKETDATKS